MQKVESVQKKHVFLYLGLLVILGLAVRIYYTPFDIPIVTDGFFSFVYAVKTNFDGALPIGYTTTNTGWANFLSLIFTLSDKTDPLQMMNVQRILSIIFSSIVIFPAYFIFQKFVNRKIAIFGCLLLIMEPRLTLISLDGHGYSLFIFLFVLGLAFFLKKTNISFIIAFSSISFAALVRYEAVLLLIPFAIMFFIYSKNRNKILQFLCIVLIVSLILIPISFLRSEVTQEYCYSSFFGEICGSDGILNNFFNRAESINNKIVGIPDTDDSIYNTKDSMIGHFVTISFVNLIKFLGIILLPYFVFFLGMWIFKLKKKSRLNINDNYKILIFSTCVMLIPSIYAYGRGFEDYRYVLIVIPLLSVFSVKIMESVPKMEKNRNIFFVLIFFIILLSIVFIQNEKSDDDLHREAFYVSKKVYQLTDTINTYQYSGYLKTAEIIEEWPELPKSDPLRLGKFEMSTTKIPTKGYETIHEFLQDEENKKLQYIVLDKRNEFFNDLRENPSNYNYLEIIFDSKDLDFENIILPKSFCSLSVRT